MQADMQAKNSKGLHCNIFAKSITASPSRTIVSPKKGIPHIVNFQAISLYFVNVEAQQYAETLEFGA